MDHFQGEIDTRVSRIYADFLSTKNTPDEQHEKSDQSDLLSSAYLLRQAAAQACAKPNDTTNDALLAKTLTQATEIMLMALPPARLEGVFNHPAWLPCEPENS